MSHFIRALAGPLVVVVLVTMTITGCTTNTSNTPTATPSIMQPTDTSVPVPPTDTPIPPVPTPVDASVAAGALDYVTFACYQCHGPNGLGSSVLHPGMTETAVIPALTTAQTVETATLTHIIDTGMGVSSGGNGHIFMPVWGAVISQQQVQDLVAYIKAGLPAVPGITATTIITTEGPVVEGQQLYTAFGCINCHAANGTGGVPNPASPDKRIPPLSGSAFKAQFPTTDSIAQVIHDGSVIGKAPIVSMPAWDGLMTQEQVDALVAYVNTFQ